jgi:hypothetical protein
MIDLTVDTNYVLDLQDDIMMNEEKNLYEFIGNDPVKAFYLGYKMHEFFPQLDAEQQYLYSKQIRHNSDSLDKYKEQISFWIKKFNPDETKEVDLCDLSENVLNNMFWDPETEDLDKVKLAFYFGNMIAEHGNNSDMD